MGECTNQEKLNVVFEDLAPTSDNDKLGIYEEALDYAFSSDKIKNIAITGLYGSGKSSLLESYKKKYENNKNNSKTKLDFVYISLAHFKNNNNINNTNNTTNNNGGTYDINDLEGKIINQLIQQINPSEIPQTRFKIKKDVDKKTIMCDTLKILGIILLLFFNIYYSDCKTFIDALINEWNYPCLSFLHLIQYVLFLFVF